MIQQEIEKKEGYDTTCEAIDRMMEIADRKFNEYLTDVSLPKTIPVIKTGTILMFKTIPLDDDSTSWVCHTDWRVYFITLHKLEKDPFNVEVITSRGIDAPHEHLTSQRFKTFADAVEWCNVFECEVRSKQS